MKLNISVFFFILLAIVHNVESKNHSKKIIVNAPKFVFSYRNFDFSNCGKGSTQIKIDLCADSYVGNCVVNSVTWTMGDGNTEVTNLLAINYNYLQSGDYNVTASVNCTLNGVVLPNVSVNNVFINNTDKFTLNPCLEAVNGQSIIMTATVLDLGIEVLPSNQTLYTTTPIQFEYTIFGTIPPSLVSNAQGIIYVDGAQKYLLPSIVNGTTSTDFYSVGQHLVELYIDFKERYPQCVYKASKVFEILPVDTICTTSCFTFRPLSSERYWVSAWAKVDVGTPVKTYEDLGGYIEIGYNGNTSLTKLYPTGEIIDGWQRISGEFTVPSIPLATDILVSLVNNTTKQMYFDDIRIHPYNASMKSYVYDSETFWLLAELDDNNYATYYEYDKEGQLIRVKKETERGIMTIQESRKRNPKN